MKLLIRALGNAAGLWLATTWVSGLSVPGAPSLALKLVNLAVVGLVFALVNSIVKPVVKKLALPLYLLTLGLAAFVVNGLMLMLTGWLTAHLVGIGAEAGVPLGLNVDSFGAAVLGSVIVSVVAAVVVAPFSRERKRKSR